MKVSALPSGGMPGTDLSGISLGRTASPEKLAAAIAIASGEQPQTTEDPQVKRAQESIRKIRMKTNASPERYEVTPEVTTDSAIPAPSEQVNASEVTQPLSPQFAALAKQRRALQVKERELLDREKALSSAPTTDGSADIIARLKSQPLSVLQENGVTYDQLTEAILSNQSGANPEIQALKAELKALKEGVDKNFVDRDTQAEEQVLNVMENEARELAKEGDAYEMIRATDSIKDVRALIKRTYKTTGEVLDVDKAMQLVEDQLIEDHLPIANTNKLKSKMLPTPAPQPQPQQRTMRTLTNRDGATNPLDRKARAMAAFRGTLKG